uniref:Uncharacterized protein n=1 Tax=Manihot esculenta TaxID=3983 RepID=A0A2C9V4Y5_MANES
MPLIRTCYINSLRWILLSTHLKWIRSYYSDLYISTTMNTWSYKLEIQREFLIKWFVELTEVEWIMGDSMRDTYWLESEWFQVS